MATLVAWHAHPDDEALFTGGTLAKAAAAGHRVVLVVATNGEAGLASETADLGTQRLAELDDSARALGVARVVQLGYRDSGYPEPWPDGSGFADQDPDQVAERLAEVLREEQADILLTYDANGGYGHPDHVQVHRTGLRAATLAETPAVFEATVNRDLMHTAARVLSKVPGVSRLIPADHFSSAFTAGADITHTINVRRHVRAKQAALRAHASQTTGASVRTVGLLGRLPWPLSRWALGTEWFRAVYDDR